MVSIRLAAMRCGGTPWASDSVGENERGASYLTTRCFEQILSLLVSGFRGPSRDQEESKQVFSFLIHPFLPS